MQLVGRVTRVTATAALLVALVACSGESTGEPSATPTGTSPATATESSSPTASTTPPTDGEAAATAATDVLKRFYLVRNELGQDPRKPLWRLKAVAVSTELAAQQNRFRVDRRKGLRQVGDTEITDLKVESVNLDNSNPKAGRVPTVVIDVCFDVSEVDVVDSTGQSVVASGRPDSGWIRYSVANYEWASNPTGAWRVASSESIERSPCAVS